MHGGQPLEECEKDVVLCDARDDVGVEALRFRAEADVEFLLSIALFDVRLTPAAAAKEERQARGERAKKDTGACHRSLASSSGCRPASSFPSGWRLSGGDF